MMGDMHAKVWFRSGLGMGLALLLAGAAGCARVKARPAAAPLGEQEQPPALRLPADVQPKAYALDLEANPAADRFAGTVTIQLSLQRATRVLWLHARGLRVSVVTARDAGRPVPASFAQVNDTGMAKVVLAQPMGPGEATVALTFDAPFGTHNDGFYKVLNGGDSYALTQFEPLSARLAFPCFDEPSFKAPLSLTLSVPEGLVAAANTAVEREENLPDKRKRWHFKATSPLPTYLYAWAVGPWDVVAATAIPANGPRGQALPLRGLAPRGQGAALAQSLALASVLVRRLEDYFGIAYPFDKLDLLAAPDFPSGAMENAGLITFNDKLLLVDEHHAPLRIRELWVRVMAHELAHQWFGDLVTMSWWDDIWLNEAFAEWLCFPIAAQVRPQYRYPLRLRQEVEDALAEDSLVSARSIRQRIGGNGDVHNAFDAVTYEKGAALIGMFERYLGPEVFRRGIHDYLTAHAFGNATVEGLLATLSRAAGRDVATPFRTFLDQPGVPLIAASLRCAGGKATLALEQSRYLPVGSKGDTHQLWQVPLCARYGDGKTLATACTLLTTQTGILDLPGKSCPAVVLPSADGEGYFRWWLPPAELRKLARATALTAPERLSLAEAVFAGYDAAVIRAADALSLLAALVADPEPSVSARLIELLEDSKDHLVDVADRPAVMKKAEEIYRPVLAKVGLKPRGPDEDVRLTERRASAAYVLVVLAESSATRKELAPLGKAYLGAGRGGDGRVHPEALEASLGGMALTAALETEPSLFEPWTEQLKTEQNPVVRQQLLGALSSDREPGHAARMREMVFDPRLRASERPVPIFRQMRDYRTRPAAWAWLQGKLDALAASLSTDDRARLPFVGRQLCSDAAATELDALFRPRLGKLEGTERNLAQTLETIHLCAALVAAQRVSAHDFFAGKAAGRTAR